MATQFGKTFTVVSTTFRKSRLLTPRINIYEVKFAPISSKSMRGEPLVGPKPWNYKKYGYNNLHAFFCDGTQKRIGENSKIILVEGLPCIGKSELAKVLANEFEMELYPRVSMDDYFINRYGYDLRKLDPELPAKYQSFDEKKFFKNPKDDKAPLMQFRFFYSKYFQYCNALAHVLNTGQGAVLERSVYSDVAFMETMFDFDYLNKHERKGYYQWKDRCMEYLLKPHLVVYLDADPQTVENNLKRRGLGEEKTFNREFLQRLSENYKKHFIEPISEHAEILVYDWNTPGDPEAVVDDIEHIDFDVFDGNDPKLRDWRHYEDQEWCAKRWMVTNRQWWLENTIVNTYIENVPRLCLDATEDRLSYERVMESARGEKYAPGFNPDMNDKGILFKTKTMLWEKVGKGA